jgi:hypothetical protein
MGCERRKWNDLKLWSEGNRKKVTLTLIFYCASSFGGKCDIPVPASSNIVEAEVHV